MKACFLVCAQHDFSTFTQFRTHFLGSGAAHGGLNLPMSINLRQSLGPQLDQAL